MTDPRRAARGALPDAPRWVETRDLLARDDARFLGTPADFVVWSPDEATGAAVGAPPAAGLEHAAADCDEILAFPENVAAVRHRLPGWEAERATLFRAPARLDGAAARPCRALRPGECAALSHLPDELHAELKAAERLGRRIHAALDGDLPVAFCYVASETEGLWDVAIDTLASHRRHGFARAAATDLLLAMAPTGKTAVWGALDGNAASLGLARKLGFEAVDALYVLSDGAAHD